ncbi:GNAT family N-acetyltransferase [Jiangella gansuensis]|uniref:GNAT family N-acetyltransferase n=1 Tax=Jiangella gansuensis TaxID=281473 RepID=UPI0004AF89CB|nr:GNAT family N-acetyltransferase [Jiangella gansuensis]
MSSRYRQHRLGSPDVLPAMQELTRRLWGPTSRWHPGELAWFWLEHGTPDPGWSVSFWDDGDRTVAWAWAKHGRQLDLHVDPAHVGVAADVLQWFHGIAGDSRRVVTVLDAETDLAGVVRAHGYRPDTSGPYFVHLGRTVDTVPEPAVPDGYRLRPVRGEDDAELRASAHNAAFSLPGRPPSELTGAAYRTLMRSTAYRPELDWLVEAPDGTAAAFCLAWLDDHTGAAVLEPVGTDPAHRRRGLASAVSLAALDAARRLGGTHARVCARGDDAYPSARATYQSIGFREYARNVRFEWPGAAVSDR